MIRRLLRRDELTCQELVELVTEYFEERLPPRDRRRFEAHLADCEGCRAYLDQMRETIRLVGALQEEAIPAEVRESLLAAFHDWKGR